MDTQEFNKKFLKICLIILTYVIVAGIFVTIGRHQAEDWCVTKKHIEMESYSYNYCPYCGEELNIDAK